MLVDAHDLEDGTVVHAGLCVVGAGAAGITIARAFLSRPDVSVCLVEGGGATFEPESQDLYDGLDAGDYALRLTVCRQRSFGGSTNLWVGWCHALEPADFEPQDYVARSGWPIDAQTLAPYYALARDTVEIGADDFDPYAVGPRVGHEPLPLDPARVRSVLYQYSPPTNFGERYGPALWDADTITTLLHASAVDIGLDAAGRAVRHIECATLAGTRLTVRADVYVLAMGGIENPRLLLAAPSGPPEGIGNASGFLGRCLMEHPHYYDQGYVVAPGSVDASLYTDRWLAPTFDPQHPQGRDVEVRAALALPRDRRRAERVVSMAATMSEARLDKALGSVGGVSADHLRGLLRGLSSEGGGEARLYRLDIRSEQRPIVASAITLGDQLDPLGMPRVEARWCIDPADLHDARRTLELWGAELGRTGLGRMWIPVDRDGEFVPTRVESGCHHLGTTRMSTSPDQGVVDEHCRVHGVDNLYVAGSSVFVTGGFANPTLTIVALAHRLAEHLGETL